MYSRKKLYIGYSREISKWLEIFDSFHSINTNSRNGELFEEINPGFGWIWQTYLIPMSVLCLCLGPLFKAELAVKKKKEKYHGL